MSQSPGNAALSLRGLRGGWGPTTIIEGLSLDIAPGETVSIIGRNGVGKTTLLELIIGRAQHQSGEIWFGGRDIAPLPIHRRTLLGMGFVPQQREVFPSLTVVEHLTIAARPGAWDEERVLALFPALTRRLRNLGSQLSGGEQQMLAIARALIGNPRLLLLDEPSEGLAPIVVEQLVAAIRDVVTSGALTVLLIEQRADIALALSDRCMIMDRGNLVFEGKSAELRADSPQLARLMGLDP